MKLFRKLICLLVPVLLIIPFQSISQKTQDKNKSDIKLIKVAKEIMTEAATCALITIDKEGRPRVRMMDAFSPESDLTVWFGTNAKSRKTEQIKNDPRVTLYYIDNDDSGYVMIHGTAEIVNSKKEKEKWWKEEWEEFYPNNRENYILIKVVPIWLEVISYSYGILGDTVNWKPPVVLFDKE